MKSFLAVLFSLLPFLVQAAWTPGSPTANLTNYFPGREPGYGDIYASGGTNGSSITLRAGTGIAISTSGTTNTISATGTMAGATNAIPYVYSPDSGLWYSLVSRTNTEGVVLSLSQVGVAATNWTIPGVVGPAGPTGVDGTNGLDGVSGITNGSDAILKTILVGNTDGYLFGSKDGLFGYFDSNLVWGADSGGFYGTGTGLSNAVEIVAGANIIITTNSARRFTVSGSAGSGITNGQPGVHFPDFMAATLQPDGFSTNITIKNFFVMDAFGYGTETSFLQQTNGILNIMPDVGVHVLGTLYSENFHGNAAELTNVVDLVAGDNITITTNSSRMFTISGSAFDASLSNSYNGTFTGVGANLSNAVEIVAGDNITITTNSARRFTIAGASSGSSYTNNAGKAGVISGGYIGTNVWGTNLLTTTGTDGQVLTVTTSGARWMNAGSSIFQPSASKTLVASNATDVLKVHCPLNSKGSMVFDYSIETTTATPGTNGVFSGKLNVVYANGRWDGEATNRLVTTISDFAGSVFNYTLAGFTAGGMATPTWTAVSTAYQTNFTLASTYSWQPEIAGLTNIVIRVSAVQNLSTNLVEFIP